LSEPDRRTGALALFIASAPLKSAGIMLAILAVASALFVYLFADPELIARAFLDPEELWELIGASLTTIAAVLAAFRIRVRGRTLPWRATPLGLFAAWQTVAIIYCFDAPLEKSAEDLLYGHSPECFLFILAISIPIGLVLFSTLHLYRTAWTWSASAMTGLAISSLAVLLLQFFHHSEMNFGDWSIHMLAMGLVVGSSAYAGQVLSSRRS